LKEKDKALLQAYANGINAFIKSVDFSDSNAGAKIFPPEFYVFGLADKIEPWHPTDSLALSRLISFHLTWNFAQDFSREVVR
jgi:acyl-homoserine lactone acylase PvdQ